MVIRVYGIIAYRGPLETIIRVAMDSGIVYLVANRIRRYQGIRENMELKTADD